MRSFYGTCFVAGGMTLALLTGCSGVGNIAGSEVGDALQQPAVQTGIFSRPSALRSLLPLPKPKPGTHVSRRSFINFAAMAQNKGNTIAISDANNNVVDLYTMAGTQIGQLTGFSSPAGMASDIKGNLYIADSANARVQIYSAGFASQPTSLPDPGQIPVGVDSFSKGAYLAVTNEATSGDGPGSVSIFKGSTLQSNITYANLLYAFFCAFDASGNLYVDGEDLNGNPIIGEIADATSGGTTFEPLTATNVINYAVGIQVTTAGQIAIEDFDNKAIYTYDPPSGGSLGAPTEITPLGGASAPVTFAFTKTMTASYAADEDGSAFEYGYPTGGTPLATITIGGEPFGTAVIPTQYPKNSNS